MKKALIILSFSSFLAFVGCGGNDSSAEQKEEQKEEQTETATEQQQQQPAADPEADKGLDLVAKSDCFTCHKVAEPSVGPSYEAVAAKYPVNDAVIDSLAGKIIKGGAGNWGQVPMTPHADLSQEDAKTMVKYVLSLKK